MEEKQCLQLESEKVTVSKVCTSKRCDEEGPDGGMAWIVAFAVCLINLIMAGLGRMSGILFVAFIEIFGVDRKSASMPFSVKSSARNLFGPVVGILGQKYGARKVIVFGGVVGTLSAAACFFAPDIMWITVLWGGVGGLGSALIVTLPQVVIGQYFDRHRTTASGLAFSGGCVGSFLFPVLLEYLLENYGISGTFLIVGAIIMHTIPAALILRKPSWLKSKPSVSGDESVDSLTVKEGNSLVAERAKVSRVCEGTPVKSTPARSEALCSTPVTNSIKRLSIRSINECTPKKGTPKTALKTSEVYPDVKFLRENQDIVVKVLKMKDTRDKSSVSKMEINHNEISLMEEVENLCLSLRCKKLSRFHKNIQRVRNGMFGKDKIKDELNSLKEPSKTADPETEISKVLNDDSRDYVLDLLSTLDCVNEDEISGSFPSAKEKAMKVFGELVKLNKLCPRVNVTVSVSEKKELLDQEADQEMNEIKKTSFLDLIKTAFKLYLNPLFIMVCMCRAVHFVTFIPAMTTVVDFTMDKGLQEDDGKYAIAAISLGDLLGRLCLGWITDRGYMTLQKYMMLVMVLQGCSTASLPMMHTKSTIFANLAVFGMLQGSLFVRHSVLISKYMRTNEQSIAMGCVNFFSGLLGFGIPIYIGYFRDTMGSYDCIFYLNGMMGAFVGLLWAFEPIFVRYVNSRRLTEKIDE